MGELIPGRATREGTRRFASGFAELPGHFRSPDGLALSSLGLGTREGKAGGGDDLAYREAVLAALASGVNVFDTALSYRLQTSERALGAALRRAFAEGLCSRDEVFVMTKGGFLALDADYVSGPRDARPYLQRTYLDSKLVDSETLVGGRHCMEPQFIADQIARSRRNLGLATLDAYLIEEPEIQLREAGPDVFRERLIGALEALEQACRQGQIAAYGLSTWSGLLLPYTDRGHLSVAELLETALDVAGADHHMRAMQLPYGVAMGEALGSASQYGGESGTVAALDLLSNTGTAVFAISPLVRGRVLGRLPAYLRDALPGLDSDAQRALQFARSGTGVTSALVGMRRREHVQENLALAKQEPLTRAQTDALLAHASER